MLQMYVEACAHMTARMFQMYVKRGDQLSQSNVVNPTTTVALEAPVMHHIRSSMRPKSVTGKNESHPLAYTATTVAGLPTIDVEPCAGGGEDEVDKASCPRCGMHHRGAGNPRMARDRIREPDGLRHRGN